ncbi:MAG: PilZ domain-containing protein [Candidatus Velthaea sp.]
MKRADAMDDTPASADTEARTHTRVGDALMVSYSISDDVAPEFTETYDIGIGGLAMLTNASLPPQQDIVLELELRADDHPKLRLNGRVRWSTYDQFLAKYRTGVEFVSIDENQQRHLLRYIDTIHHLRDLGVL